MITEQAVVVAIDGDRITVEASVKSTCNTCNVQSDCGTGTIASAMAPRTQQLTVQSLLPVNIGDHVTVGIPESGLLTASLMLYIIPILTLLTSAVLSNVLLPLDTFGRDILIVLLSAGVTLMAFVFVSNRLKKFDKQRFQPVLISRIKANIDAA